MQTAPTFPYPEPPAPGVPLEVAPGILWLRFALPFLLNHVNVYLIEDDGGWAILDTGLGNDETKAAWEALFAGPLAGQRITRVICTHYHPDHVGLVGWLTERFGCPLWMSRTDFLTTLVLQNRSFAANPAFYAERGLPLDDTVKVADGGHHYLRLITGLPTRYSRLVDGANLRIGGRDFSILTGGGHAPEQAMLYCAEERIFFPADQVLTKISPNISVHGMEPDANPLGAYLASLRRIGEIVPADALTLPGHHVPFTGLHVRLDELAAHHAARCELIADACKAAPRTPAEMLPVLFKRVMDPHQTGFAFAEVVAHVNYMVARGQLRQERSADGILRISCRQEDLRF
jgi:glyoxylase-like metal-dependent hydrolase (beta-lactamase superfamily II)